MTIETKTLATVGRWLRSGSRILPAAALAVGIAGCDIDELLDVEDPEVANPGSVQTPTALPAVFAGVIRDFQYAYSGTGVTGGGSDNDNLIVLTGMLSDELYHVGTFPTRRDIDRRDISATGEDGTTDNGQLDDVYRNLHRARRAAEIADELYVAAEAEDDVGRSIASSIAGYTYILFGEAWCEGVPFSEIDSEGGVTEAPSSTRTETFQTAIDRFDAAISVATAAGNAQALNLARIGKARALLNENDAAGAAAIAAQVPSDFEYVIEHSENSDAQNNGVFIYAQENGRYAVADTEGINGLPFESADDPRAPILVGARLPFDALLFTDFGIEYVAQDKYEDRSASAVLADGREARFIEAEAALRAGNVNDLLAKINAARAIDGLPALTLASVPGTEAGRVNLLFRERAFSLWLTAHRLGDMRRLVRQYGRAPNSVFPTGEYFRDALQYGSDVNFPIHVDENNNSLFNGCLNRSA
jgi:hypothetical protein